MKRRYSDRFTFPPALILDVDIIATGTDRQRRIPAKIDTGADMTAIPDSLIAELKLLEFNKRILYAVGHPGYLCFTYLATIMVESRSFEIEMATHNRPYVLLGRDILNQFILHADGPAEIFELTWSSPHKKRRPSRQ